MVNYFDTVAQNWDENKVHLKRTKAIAAALLQMVDISKNMQALEFGAGTGLLSFALQKYFAEITLMDSSAEMIKTTFEKIIYAGNKKLIPVYFDLEKKEFTDRTFDVIFTQMALHHVNNIDRIIGRFNNLLNPGGILAIADLYSEDGTFHDMLFNGHYGFDPEELSKKLTKKGFININHRRVFIIRKENGEKPKKKYPVFLLTAEKPKS
jgi:ubiquinone/menaquinone biosynthesis C-methylase UbiE